MSDCEFCDMDDTDIPTMEQAVDDIVNNQSYRTYNERMHKKTFVKGGGIKISEDNDWIMKDSLEYIRLMKMKISERKEC